MEEREIDLVNCFFSILKKWRSILLWIVIFTVLCGGYAGYKGYKAYSAAKASANLSPEVQKQDAGAALSEADKEATDLLIAKYDVNLTNKNKLLAYMDESLLYNYDSSNTASASASYLINFDADDELRDSLLKQASTKYLLKLDSDEVYEKVAKTLNIDTKPQYIKELISLSNPSSDIINISVIADSEENAEKIFDILNKEVEAITKNLSATYDNLSCETFTTNKSFGGNDKVSTLQAEKITAVEACNKAMKDISDAVPETGKAYFNQAISDEELSADTSSPVAVPSFIHFVSKKLVLIGILLGIFLPICWYGIKYILTGTIKTSDEVAVAYKEVLFGTFIFSEGKKCFIDKWINRCINGKAGKMSPEITSDMVATSVIEALKSKEKKSVCFVSTLKESNFEGLKDTFEKIKKAGIDVTYGFNLLADSEALKNMTSSENVVAVEAANKTLYSDTNQVLKLIKTYSCKLLGEISVM